jgi:hypothetical protein
MNATEACEAMCGETTISGETREADRTSHLPHLLATDAALSFSDEIRFWEHVEIIGSCWVCQLKGVRGYSRFRVNHRSVYSHRWAWELVNPPLKNEEHLDHICRNRACVNPSHLRILDDRTNILIGFGPAAINHRKTNCIRGHLLEGKNLFLQLGRNGIRSVRVCRTCKREKDRRLYRKAVFAL